MSDYTPTMDEIKHAALTYTAIASEADWDRAFAAHDAEVAARSIKTWVNRVRSELDATRAEGIELGRDYLEGLYSALQQAADHAARIENDLAEQGTEKPAPTLVDMRDPECVKAWPECETFGSDPRCCRFPKSCSAGSWVPVDQPASVPGVETRTPSGPNRGES